MLKKTITFKDLDGNDVTRDFYFDLDEVELAKMELTAEGGSFSEQLKEIIATSDPAQIIDTFEMILGTAYGVRLDDNITFDKTPELSRRFMRTKAYSALFMELITNEQALNDFMLGIMPADFVNADDLAKVLPMGKIEDVRAPGLEPVDENDLSRMTREDLEKKFQEMRDGQL